MLQDNFKLDSSRNIVSRKVGYPKNRYISVFLRKKLLLHPRYMNLILYLVTCNAQEKCDVIKVAIFINML